MKRKLALYMLGRIASRITQVTSNPELYAKLREKERYWARLL